MDYIINTMSNLIHQTAFQSMAVRELIHPKILSNERSLQKFTELRKLRFREIHFNFPAHECSLPFKAKDKTFLSLFLPATDTYYWIRT